MRNSSVSDVTLVLHAGTDAGFAIARELLGAGRRIVVTSRHAAELTRILHGRSTDQVLAIAADPTNDVQLRRLMDSAETRFGRIDTVIDAAA